MMEPVVALWQSLPMLILVFVYVLYFMTLYRIGAFSRLGATLIFSFRHLVRLELPLRQAMDSMAEPLPVKRKRIVQRIAAGMDRGLLLGDALASVPRVVSPVEAEVIRVGEMSGNLEQALEVSLQGRITSQTLRAAIVLGLTEPINVCVMLTGLVTFTLPAFREMFEELGFTPEYAPRITRLVLSGYPLIWVSALLASIACAMLLVNAMFVRSLRRMRRILNDTVQRVVYCIPVIHGIIRRRLVTEFCLELAMLLRVGTPVPQALRVIAEGTMNPWFRSRVRKAAELCEQGSALAGALDVVHLDRRVAWDTMLAHDSGLLVDALQNAHDDMEQRYSWAQTLAVALLGPLLLLGMGVIVGCVVIGLFMPLIMLANSLM